jgi:hypothetical protein
LAEVSSSSRALSSTFSPISSEISDERALVFPCNSSFCASARPSWRVSSAISRCSAVSSRSCIDTVRDNIAWATTNTSSTKITTISSAARAST